MILLPSCACRGSLRQYLRRSGKECPWLDWRRRRLTARSATSVNGRWPRTGGRRLACGRKTLRLGRWAVEIARDLDRSGRDGGAMWLYGDGERLSTLFNRDPA